MNLGKFEIDQYYKIKDMEELIVFVDFMNINFDIDCRNYYMQHYFDPDMQEDYPLPTYIILEEYKNKDEGFYISHQPVEESCCPENYEDHILFRDVISREKIQNIFYRRMNELRKI